MIGIKTKNAPKPSTVVPYFLASALFFILLGILFLISSQNILLYISNPKLVALVHIITLGILTMTTMGTLHQFVPVVFNSEIFSEKIAKHNFYFFTLSLTFLIYSFFTHSYLIYLPISASLISISIWLFIFNIFYTYFKSKKKDIASKFIVTALAWLFLTTIYGLLQAYNFRFAYLSNIDNNYLKIHFNFGLIGWLLMLIIGISSIIIPMFLVSHRFVDRKKLKTTYFLINSGLITLWINWQFINKTLLTSIAWGLIIIGIFVYLIFIFNSFKFKKKKPDIAMKHVLLAFIIAVIPIFLSLIIIINSHKQILNSLSQAMMIYIASILLGLYINLVIGITYRTLPFIAWLYRFQKYVGKVKVPKPDELYNSHIANIQFILHIAMFISIISAIILHNQILTKISGILMVLSATLFTINVFRIVLFKQIKNNTIIKDN